MTIKCLILFFAFCFVTVSPLPVEISAIPQQIITEAAKPYDFGYEFADGLGMSQFRKETADGNGLVQGSYGYVDPDGLYRSVEYKADNDGYRAIIKSNEPGMANQNTADATFLVETPPAAVLIKNALAKNSGSVSDV